MKRSTPRVLVTGAAGVLGKAVTSAFRARAVPLRGASRRERPSAFDGAEWVRMDLVSGRGVDDAVAGIETIVHCASNPRKPGEDLAGLANVLRALGGERVRLVYVGIAGTESALSFRYYRTKLECERLLEKSGVRHTIVRATQFHEFIDYVLGRLTFGPWLFAPAMELQPVDVGWAADRIVDRALADVDGRAPDVCGPEALDRHALCEAWLAARRLRKSIVPAPRIGPLGALAKISLVHGEAGGFTWGQWLALSDRNESAYGT